MILKMDAHPGTYALMLQADRRQTVQVGRLGQLAVEPGCYVYVGSALGPGGVRARGRSSFSAGDPSALAY